jgi:hypothetical protein
MGVGIFTVWCPSLLSRVKNYIQSQGIKSAVVSMSLGGSRSAALNDAASDLTAAGITVVVAAGGWVYGTPGANSADAYTYIWALRFLFSCMN